MRKLLAITVVIGMAMCCVTGCGTDNVEEISNVSGIEAENSTEETTDAQVPETTEAITEGQPVTEAEKTSDTQFVLEYP